MDYVLGNVYSEDARDHIKVVAKKDIRYKGGMFIFRKGEIYDAIKDQHNNIQVKSINQNFDFKSDVSSLYFKKLNRCSCGRFTTSLFCDTCKSKMFWNDVDSQNQFN